MYLGIDKRTLYDIESDKTAVVSDRFDQMLKYYKVPHQVIFDLANDHSTFHNIIHDAKRDAIVVNQGKSPSERDSELEALREMIVQLQENDRFQKTLIERLLSEKGA